MAINLASICGCPKYPSPQARFVIIDIKGTIPPPVAFVRLKKFGSIPSTPSVIVSTPPICTTAYTGTTKSAKNISIPCITSVSETAKKPPRNVYPIITIAPITSAT